ncbi:MAG: sulfate respiration complex protein HmcD [Thermodesulfobacteriota bacterium]
METHYHTLYDFLFNTKGLAYILMGVMLVCLVGFWYFLTAREDDQH